MWRQVAAERRTLADFLETLQPADWDVPSLCARWRVRDVVAHIAWGPAQPFLRTLGGMVRSGFRPNRAVADTARRWGGREPAEMVRHLRRTAEQRRHSPIITPTHVLADLLAHNLDIRRPLGRPRPVPADAFRLSADLLAGIGWPLRIVFDRSPRRVLQGLRLVADDVDWAHGDGPEVRGSADTMLLVITGRRQVDPAELTGPGAATLYERIGWPACRPSRLSDTCSRCRRIASAAPAGSRSRNASTTAACSAW